MKPARPRFSLKQLMLFVAVSAVLCWTLRLAYERLYRFYYRDLPGGGPDIQVVMPDGTTIRVHVSDADRLIGHKINSEKLVEIVQVRISTTRQNAANGIRGQSLVPYWRIATAAEILVALHHPQAFDVLVSLLDDPHFYLQSAAAYSLEKLNDKRALPYLLEKLEGNNQPADYLVHAISALGDATTADYLFQNHGAIMWQFVPKGIDQMTGLSSKEFLEGWNRSLPINSPQFATALREWWEKNKHKVMDPTQGA